MKNRTIIAALLSALPSVAFASVTYDFSMGGFGGNGILQGSMIVDSPTDYFSFGLGQITSFSATFESNLLPDVLHFDLDGFFDRGANAYDGPGFQAEWTGNGQFFDTVSTPSGSAAAVIMYDTTQQYLFVAGAFVGACGGVSDCARITLPNEVNAFPELNSSAEFNVSIASPDPAPIPLPAGGLLLGTALLSLARRKARA